MRTHGPDRGIGSRTNRAGTDRDRERRLGLLIRRLPQRVQTVVRWLRQPNARWVRIPAGVLLILGSFLSILPVFGLWMLPLGLVLLAEDIRSLRNATGRVLAWIEHRRPRWMGVDRPGEISRTSTSTDKHRL
ncbi:MAG TPA: DUF2892 domain-containing protein [Acetobacteraceae bacterium]|nr:DUF2892 domain-containing protein [Acetobacteraceae bacterium]